MAADVETKYEKIHSQLMVVGKKKKGKEIGSNRPVKNLLRHDDNQH